jgi:hypothetical protein
VQAKALRRLATGGGGFNGPHVSPRVGRSNGRFCSTQRSLVLRVQLFLFLPIHGGTRGVRVLFLDPCIHIFPGPYTLLGKRNTGE